METRNTHATSRKLMVISGIMGLAFFLIANFTNIFVGSSLLAGVLQLIVNLSVFAVWMNAFVGSKGLEKFIAFFGVIVPICMAMITLLRVILPALLY